MIGTIVVGIILSAVIALVIIYMIKSKKKGKNFLGCGGNCSSCQTSCPYHISKK